MKGKKFLWVMLPLAAGLILAGCNNDKGSSSSDAGGDNTSSSTPAPVDPGDSSSSTPTPTPVDPVQHRDGLNKTLADGAITREYDKRFDEEVEDFSGESLLGVSDGVSHKGYLREIVDSNLTSFQNSPNAAIYKMASSAFDGDKTLLGQSVVNFKMRIVEGKLALKDLIFGIRPGDDNSDHVYPISLDKAVDGDQEALPELTNEFQTLSISISESIGDENTLFPGTDLKVLDSALGMHLYVKAEAEVSAVIEIAEVSYSKGDSTVVIDDFARDKIAGNPNVYWGPTDCADAVLVRKGVEISKGKKYTTPTLSETQRAYSHVVLDVLGDMSGASVEVAYDNNTKKELAFAELKAKTDQAVVNAVNGMYAPLAIDLSVFGTPEGANIKTITIKNDGDNELEIANVFMTNFQEPQLDKKYPHLNTETAVTFDNFERDFASLNEDWTASATDSRNVDAGINGFVSYANGANISTSNGVLHLPATDAYDEVTIGSTHVLKGAQYLVFSISGEEGYDLSNFRFELGGSTQAVWFNSALAMEGVKTYGDENIQSPYKDMASGYTWYVVDLTLHNLEAKDLIAIYYAGEKDITIDSIFYANSFSATKVRDGWADTAAADLSAYKYAGNCGPAVDGDYLGFTVQGDGTTATFESIRFAHNGTTLWPKDNAVTIYDENGSKVSYDTVVPAEPTTYYADLSVFPAEGDGWTHVHAGDGYTGTLTFSEVFKASSGIFYEGMAAKDVDYPNGGYGYVGGWDVTSDADKIYVDVSSSDGSSDLSQFRIEKAGGATVWAKDVAGFIKNVDGTAVDLTAKLTTEAKTIVIDLKAAGINCVKGDVLHFHNSQDAAWKLSLGASSVLAEEYPYATALANYSQAWVKGAPAE